MNDYYEQETIQIVVDYKISFQKGSQKGREYAIKQAVREVPFSLSGCADYGCYRIERGNSKIKD